MILNEGQVEIIYKNYSYILDMSLPLDDTKSYFWYGPEDNIIKCRCTLRPIYLAIYHERGHIHQIIASNDPSINCPQF